MKPPMTHGSEYETCKCGEPGDAHIHDIWLPEFDHPFEKAEDEK